MAGNQKNRGNRDYGKTFSFNYGPSQHHRLHREGMSPGTGLLQTEERDPHPRVRECLLGSDKRNSYRETEKLYQHQEDSIRHRPVRHCPGC